MFFEKQEFSMHRQEMLWFNNPKNFLLQIIDQRHTITSRYTQHHLKRRKGTILLICYCNNKGTTSCCDIRSHRRNQQRRRIYQLIAVGMARGMEARIFTHDNFWAKITEAIHHLHHPRLISGNNLKRVYEGGNLQCSTSKEKALFL